MKPGRLLSVGLLGRLLAILLATAVLEFAVSTLVYERSSRALIREDEAHRLAEHLVVTRKLMSERSWLERPAMAERLTTSRYDIHWAGSTQPPQPEVPELARMRARVIEWEPLLADADLRMRILPVGRQAMLFGGFRLPDRTWVSFRAAAPSSGIPFNVHRFLIALLPAALVLLIGALLFRHTLRPMGMLARAAERIGRGGGVTLPEAGPAEVRRVIRAFNTMQARIHQLIADRTQALAAVGHDLRTPLARLQLRSDGIVDPTLRRNIESDVTEMEAMVSSLLAYLGGESDPEAPMLTDVAVLVQTIVDNAADRGGDARYVGTEHVEAKVRPVALKRAVGNLVENALHYGHSARASVSEEDGVLVIAIEDDGPGIPEERLADAVRPFARLDPARGRNTAGLGLGLAIVTRVAEQEGGTLALSNRPEGGLRAELRLPR